MFDSGNEEVKVKRNSGVDMLHIGLCLICIQEEAEFLFLCMLLNPADTVPGKVQYLMGIQAFTAGNKVDQSLNYQHLINIVLTL